VELKSGILDAEAESVQKSLTLLGIPSLHRVTMARIYDLEFDGLTRDEAEARAQEAVDRLLANPVIHRVELRPASG
jgi:phosphoribosylformylglycinamidine synthase PurS subunit